MGRRVSSSDTGECWPAWAETPLSWLRSFQLPLPVVSCESAARAKGFPLERELKTLVIDATTTQSIDPGARALLVAHVRGDRRLSLRAVKRALGVTQARLAGNDSLDDLGVEPGTIHPFQPALWGLRHLVAREVLSLPWVTTNSGRLDGFIVFDPVILLRAECIVVDNLEEPVRP